jgi:MoxR-like ATPase
VLNAFEASPSVLLIDEIDRADDEFEAFLLEALADFSITIPELGTIKAKVPPIVILTSNRSREVHDALKRRCLYHWLEHPGRELEAAILRRKLDGLSVELCDQITNATQRLRSENLLKAPGMAESLDWAAALMALDVRELDRTTVSRTIGALLKYREDQEQVRRDDFSVFLSSSLA